MSRGRLVAIVIVPTLLLGAAIGVLLLMDAADKREQVRAADQAGAAYDDAHQEFREELAGQLNTADFADAGAVAQVVTQAAESAPTLDEVSAYGAEHSDAYRYAEQVEEQASEDLAALDEALEVAQQGQTFVQAADQALAVDPGAFLAETSLPDGGPVRQEVLPPLRRNLAQFEQTAVPEDAESVHEEVSSALGFVVSEAEKLAGELDAGRGYRFEYGSQYGQARQAIQQYGNQLVAGLREAFDRVVGDPAARV